jgi:hypothetical protein
MNTASEIEKLKNWAGVLEGDTSGNAAALALRSMLADWSAQITKHGSPDSLQFMVHDLQLLQDSITQVKVELEERLAKTRADLLTAAQSGDIAAFTEAYERGATVEQIKRDDFLDLAVRSAGVSGKTDVVRFILDKRFEGAEILTFDTMVGLGYSVERSVACVRDGINKLQEGTESAFDLPGFL